MITRFLLKIVAFTGAVILLATAAAVGMGRLAGGSVIVTVASRGNDLIRLIDLDRTTRFDLPVPVQHIADITLEQSRPSQALVMTYEPYDDGRFQSRLYAFDLEAQELHLLTVANQVKSYPGDIRSHFDLAWSPDGEMLAFYDPDDSGLYITDLAAFTTQHIAELTAVAALVWSPDSRQIAVPQGADALFIANADGSHPRLFTDLEPRGFSLSWSHDSQWIVLSQSVEPTDATRMIDPHDGEIYPGTDSGGQR